MQGFNIFMGGFFILLMYHTLIIYPNKSLLKGGKGQALTVYKLTAPHHRHRGFQGAFTIPANIGLLFEFKESKPPIMWMKDVRHPLDIIFLNKEKKILHIHYNATPYSTHPITGGLIPAYYVLELPAGQAQMHALWVGIVTALKVF